MPDINLDIPATVQALRSPRAVRLPFGADNQRRAFTGRVPYQAIRWIVDRFHVSESNEAIAAEVYRRAKHTNATRAELRECIRFALAVHWRNRVLYSAVMGGLL